MEKSPLQSLPGFKPPTYLLASFVLMIVLDLYLPVRRLVEPPWTRGGAVLIAVGFVIVGICVRQFRRRGTTLNPSDQASELVEDGLYRWSRNPIYLGMVLVLIGTAWLMGTLTPWIVVPFFAVTIQQQFIGTEERSLARKFGDRYAEYCQRTRRWI